jgi:hypothetical protein
MPTWTYEYKEYDQNKGVTYETDEKMIVKITIEGEVCTLSSNREGLLSLAKSFIKLADDNVPIGCHYHLDHPVFMEEGSSELIVEKI